MSFDPNVEERDGEGVKLSALTCPRLPSLLRAESLGACSRARPTTCRSSLGSKDCAAGAAEPETYRIALAAGVATELGRAVHLSLRAGAPSARAA